MSHGSLPAEGRAVEGEAQAVGLQPEHVDLSICLLEHGALSAACQGPALRVCWSILQAFLAC